MSRGSEIPSKRTPKLLFDHLEKVHSVEHSIVVELRKVKAKVSGNSSMNGSSGSGAGNSSMNGSSGSGASVKSSTNGSCIVMDSIKISNL